MKKNKLFYSVTVNIPGCLPDMSGEPEAYRLLADAERAMRGHAHSLREEGYSVVGDRKHGYAATLGNSEYAVSLDRFTAEEWEAMGNEVPE